MSKKSFKIDFIGIGGERCASTWISQCLKEHPEVRFSDTKEIAFFNEYDPHLLKIKNLRYKRGIKWYENQFPRDSKGKKIGEYSVGYLYSPKAAKRIKKHFPDVKLIVSLRDPVERAYSQYLHDKSIGLIPKKSFEFALKTNDSFIKKGLYFKYISNYLELFGDKKMHIILYDDIKKDPKKTIKQLFKFLDIDQDYEPTSLHQKFNVASEATIPALNQFLIKAEYILVQNNLLKHIHTLLENSGVRKLIHKLGYHKNRVPIKNYPKIKRSTAKRLYSEFEEDINNLEKLLKRRLTSWEKYKKY